MNPADKVALVTGAGSGIGFALSLALAGRGSQVVALDLDPDGLERLEAESSERDSAPLTIATDVTRWDELAAAFERSEERFGGVDIVCNVAGVNTGRPRFPDAERARWERTLAIDLWAVLAGTQLGAQMLRRRGGGVIANIGSLGGITPFPADPVYAAAKGGVVALTQSLGFLEEDNIRVVCLCPGMVDTPLLKKRQLTAAEERIVRSIPLLRADDVADSVVDVIENDALHAVTLGLLPERPAKVIPPPLRFRDDPSEAFKS
jgi:NAD(P)-dependent dehydrogenase (short-subunit alcohol dehydrogenase family)